MRLLRLYAENAYSYKTLDLDFTQYRGAVTTILGWNSDQKTSNGAAKSAIVKLLYFGLTGKELSDESIDAIINRSSQDGCYVEQTWEDKDQIIKIVRFRKYKVSQRDGRPVVAGVPFERDPSLLPKGTGVQVYLNGEVFDINSASEVKGDVNKRVQQIIEDRFGITPRLFLSAVLMAQNQKHCFLTDDDATKKDILVELLDFKAFKTAFELVKIDLSSMEATVERLEFELCSGQKVIEEESRITLKARKEADEFELSREKELDVAICAAMLLKQQVEAGLVDSSPIDTTKLESEVEVIRGEVVKKEQDSEKLKAQQKTHVDLMNLKNETFNQLKDSQSAISRTDEILEQASKETSELHASLTEVQCTVELESRISSCERDALELEASCSKTNSEVSVWLTNNGPKLGELRTRITESEKQKNTLLFAKDCPTCARPFSNKEHAHASERRDDLTKSISGWTNELTQLLGEQAIINQKQDALPPARRELERLSALLLGLKQQQAKNDVIKGQRGEIEQKLAQVKATSSQLESSRSQARSQLLTAKEELNSVIAQAAGSQRLIEILAKSESFLPALRKQLESKVSDLGALRVKNQERLNTKSLLEEKRMRLIEAEHRVASVKSTKNPYTELLASSESKIQFVQLKLAEFSSRINSLKEERMILSFWKAGFATTGIQSFLCDEMVDTLNNLINSYLEDLFDGALRVSLESETVNSKGVVSNKIQTKFLLNGKVTPQGLLSGGEIQRAIIACDLALSDLAEKRLGTQIGLKFLDEPFNGIDAAGEERCFKLFNRVAQSKDGFFVISHNEKTQNMCPNSLYVVKENQESRVVTRSEFESISKKVGA